MYTGFKKHLEQELAGIKEAGLYKNERIIVTPQSSDIEVETAEGKGEVLNFCANNYLGLSDNSRLIEAAKKAMDARGYGMSSVRRTFTRSLRLLSAVTSRPRTPYCMRHVSMPTAVCSNRCSPRRTPS